MTSHKERIELINKGFSLPRNYYRSSQNGHSNSHLTSKEKKPHSSENEVSHPDEHISYHEPQSPIYRNMSSEQVKFEDNCTGPFQKSLERQHLPRVQSKMASINTNNTSRGYINTQEQRTISNSNLLFKSQSLNALKSTEPSKTLAKSSIQQEYHDKLVQDRITGLSYGKAKKPCQIATIMFILFGLFFIVGLTLICLTYIYKNINFSLDKGEMIGPVILAGSFIFLGVGIKFIYDSYRIARAERRHIAYRGYDRHYVGFKNGQNGVPVTNEKLTSGTTTGNGLTRIPNKKLVSVDEEQRTIGRSSQQVYGKVYDSEEL